MGEINLLSGSLVRICDGCLLVYFDICDIFHNCDLLGPFGFTTSIQKWLQMNKNSDHFVTLYNECVAGFSIWHQLECSFDARTSALHLFQGTWKAGGCLKT